MIERDIFELSFRTLALKEEMNNIENILEKVILAIRVHDHHAVNLIQFHKLLDLYLEYPFEEDEPDPMYAT